MQSDNIRGEEIPETFKVGEVVGFYSEKNRVPDRPIPVTVTSVNGSETTVVTATGRKMTFKLTADGGHVALQEDETIESSDRIAYFDFPAPKSTPKNYLFLLLVILSSPLRLAVYCWDRMRFRKDQRVVKYITKAAEYTSQNESVPFVVGENVLVVSSRGHLYQWKYPFCSAKVTKVDGDEVTVSYQVNMGGLKGISSKAFILLPEPNPGRMYFSHEITPETTIAPEMLLRRPPMQFRDRWSLQA